MSWSGDLAVLLGRYSRDLAQHRRRCPDRQ